MEVEDIIIGPFKELLTMSGMSLRGAISNEKLKIIRGAGIRIRGEEIIEVGDFGRMSHDNAMVHELEGDFVGLPGFIDAHTHICFGGSRYVDYSARNAGMTYLEIAKAGGGIWDTVLKTRNADKNTLYRAAETRIKKLLDNGVTTVEVKSGYGLNREDEIKQLEVIKELSNNSLIDIIPTCLAAHMKPRDFEGSNKSYLEFIATDLLPDLRKKGLCCRVDIFVEESAFTVDEARHYLREAQDMGYDITIHGDQFSTGGSKLAVELGVLSVDHLEASDSEAISLLAKSEVVATVLPGASLGLGISYAPARALLDEGAIVCIASDWNPGSAPMGNLLTQAALMGASEKLTDAEVFSGITFRAAKALGLSDRGKLKKGMIADINVFPAADFREILYHQGELKPKFVWKKGRNIGKGE